jgi:hypothetical protein
MPCHLKTDAIYLGSSRSIQNKIACPKDAEAIDKVVASLETAPKEKQLWVLHQGLSDSPPCKMSHRPTFSVRGGDFAITLAQLPKPPLDLDHPHGLLVTS